MTARLTYFYKKRVLLARLTVIKHVLTTFSI